MVPALATLRPRAQSSGVLPARAHSTAICSSAEAEPSPVQDIGRCRLLGDQDGLALRQDQGAADKLQTLREARQIPTAQQRLRANVNPHRPAAARI